MNYEISEFNSAFANAPLFLKQGVADRRCLSWLITHWHGAKLREAYLWVAVHPLLPTPTRLWGSPVVIQVQGCACHKQRRWAVIVTKSLVRLHNYYIMETPYTDKRVMYRVFRLYPTQGLCPV